VEQPTISFHRLKVPDGDAAVYTTTRINAKSVSSTSSNSLKYSPRDLLEMAATCPIELLEVIFSHLITTESKFETIFSPVKKLQTSHIQQIQTLGLVCRQWRFAANEVLYSRPTFSLPCFLKWKQYLQENVGSWESVVRRLDLAAVPYLTRVLVDSDLVIIPKFSSLSFLSLEGCNLLTDEGVLHALLDGDLILNNLISLNLSGCTQLTDVSIQSIAGIAGLHQNLRHLYLNGLRRLSNLSVYAITDYLIPGLTTLEIEYCFRVTDDAIINLAKKADGKFPRLRRIALMGCVKISRVGLEFLMEALLCRQLANLKYESPYLSHLSLTVPSPSGCPGGETDFDSVFTKFPMPLFRGLTHLSLHVGTSLDDESLLHLGSFVGATLVSLSLNYLDAVTEQGLSACLDQCTNLRHLAIRNSLCPRGSFEHLISLDISYTFRATAFLKTPNLRLLNATGCPGIDLNAFLLMLAELPKLKYIDLSRTVIAWRLFEINAHKQASTSRPVDLENVPSFSSGREKEFRLYELWKPNNQWCPTSCLLKERPGLFSNNHLVMDQDFLDAIRMTFKC
jgi:hypothetical protein